MSRHLLVTNDFPPKVGGIQSYLWELWRRLPADEFAVYTTPHEGARSFDASQPFEVIRSREPWLLPGPHLVRRVNRIAASRGAALVVIDPAVPAGLIGPRLERPYAVVAHGAEVTVPGRLPLSRPLLARVLARAAGVIAAGDYAAAECERAARRPLRAFVIPPGVDTARFGPLGTADKAAARARLGLSAEAPTIASVSRLVPRKGMDTLVRAAARLADSHPGVQIVIAGDGRDRRRLARLARRLKAPVRLLGRIADDDIAALYGCTDVFAMLCRTRWRDLEQEGFGIVFLEAAATGVPQVAGRSGGAAEAVAHEQTGIVLDDPSAEAAAHAIGSLIDDPARRAAMGEAAQRRVEAEFCYDGLALRLRTALTTLASQPAPAD